MSFKLPNFLNWMPLNALRNEMKAPLAESFTRVVEPPPIDLSISESLSSDSGVTITFDEIQPQSDGTLTYHDYRVLLYIRDIQSINGKENLPRYHLTFCQVLEKMHKNDRSHRYVVANSDTGDFQVNIIDHSVKTRSVRLKVCQHCLDTLRWKGFSIKATEPQTRLQMVKDFALPIFFEEYPRDLIAVKPLHTSDTAPLNTYAHDWHNISRNIKKARGYQCKNCRIILKQSDSKFLHVHHRNGEKHDNKDSNLDVLCIACHASQPMHGHMQRFPDYKAFTARLSR